MGFHSDVDVDFWDGKFKELIADQSREEKVLEEKGNPQQFMIGLKIMNLWDGTKETPGKQLSAEFMLL